MAKHASAVPRSFPWLKLLPFLEWLPDYGGRHLRNDLFAGLTVALVLIPQSMAYAQLAGLPAYYGLYAAFLPPTLAALFGSSHQLATGPVAVVSLMAAVALQPLATSGSPAFIGYAVLLSLMVGLFQFSLGMLHLGLVVNFLSQQLNYQKFSRFYELRQYSKMESKTFFSCLYDNHFIHCYRSRFTKKCNI